MPSAKLSRGLLKRLLPLYIAVFFHGFVLWYPIEKLFMKGIGFTDGTIGLAVAIYSIVMLVLETPSGLLADRWSRKGVLILASVALALCALIGGLSYDVLTFTFCFSMWGVFFALYSGTYQSIVYDTLLEEEGDARNYERYYGRLQIWDSASLVAGSLLGAGIASLFGLRITFFLSVPLALAAIVALWRFREPVLHKADGFKPILQQVGDTYRAVIGRGRLVPVMIVLVTSSTLSYMVYEFSQLWAIALAAPLILYGPIGALMLSTIGIGGASASFFKLDRYRVMLVTLGVLLISSAALVFIPNLVVAVAAIFGVCTCLVAMQVVFNKLLHDALKSSVRAGAASAVSTVGRMIIIPLSVLFGYISEQESVFAAGWIFFALAVIITAFTLMTYSRSRVLPKFSPESTG